MVARLVPSRPLLTLIKAIGGLGILAGICMALYDAHMFLACAGHYDVCGFFEDETDVETALHFTGPMILCAFGAGGMFLYGSTSLIHYYHDEVVSGEIVDKHITSGCGEWMIYVKGENRVGKVRTYGWAVTTAKWQQLQIGDMYTRSRR